MFLGKDLILTKSTKLEGETLDYSINDIQYDIYTFYIFAEPSMSDYLELNAGKDAVLRCNYSSIRWFFSNGPLSQKFDYTSTESEYKLKKVQNIDSGIYICIIKKFNFAKLASINLFHYAELKVFGM